MIVRAFHMGAGTVAERRIEWGEERKSLVWSYVCVQCAKAFRTIWLAIDAKGTVTSVRKIGQEPPWSTRIEKSIASNLSESDLELYRKALLNASQGFGIGALAYFRRLVEQEVDALLGVLEETATIDEDTVALERLAAAKGQQRAEERLRLVRTPPRRIFAPGGFNPMKILYDCFSEGLHSRSDSEPGLDLAFGFAARSTTYSRRFVRQTMKKVDVSKALNRAASERGTRDE